MDIVDHMSAASTNRSVAVQSTSLRSCLKKPNNSAAKSDRTGRNVQFAEFDWVYEIESFKEHRYLWAAEKQCREEHFHFLRTDEWARAYIVHHDMAYAQLSSGSVFVSKTLQRVLINDMLEGYRTLEIYSDKRRHKSADHSKLVLANYNSLVLPTPMGDEYKDWVAHQLRNYSERLSLDSRRWAAFMGFVDFFAMAVENVSSHADAGILVAMAVEKVASRSKVCILPTLALSVVSEPPVNVPPVAAVKTPPMAVVSIPPPTTQHQESLVHETVTVERVPMKEEPTVPTALVFSKELQQDEQHRDLSLVQRMLRTNAYHGGNNWSMRDLLGSATKRPRAVGRKVDCFE
jgi:hypothetical protein